MLQLVLFCEIKERYLVYIYMSADEIEKKDELKFLWQSNLED